MMLELVLAKAQDSQEQLAVYFELHKTDFAKRYVEKLRPVSDQSSMIRDPDRTYNFPGDKRDLAWIANSLNECIDAINSHYPKLIEDRAKPYMDQVLMNKLHVHFEKLRGSFQAPSKLFLMAPGDIKRRIMDYNLLIHRYEDRTRIEEHLKNGIKASPRVIATFKTLDRAELQEQDYALFTKQVTWGRWYIDYFELGKPLWDLYQDEDDAVSDENIRPLRHYGADGLIEFSATESDEEYQTKMLGFERWWHDNEAFLSQLGFKWGDPRNAIGSIPVADIIRDRGAIAGLSEDDIVTLMGNYPIVFKVKIHS